MNDIGLLYSKTDYQPFIYKAYLNYIEKLPEFETTCFENRTIKIGFYVDRTSKPNKLVFAPFELFNIKTLIKRKCSEKTKFIMYFELYKFETSPLINQPNNQPTHYHQLDNSSIHRITGDIPEIPGIVPLKFVGSHANLLVVELDTSYAYRIDTCMPCEEPLALKEVLTRILGEYGINYKGYYSTCKDFSQHGDLCRWVVLAQYQYRDKVDYSKIKKLVLEILLNFIEEIIKKNSQECLLKN
jgi:hypothetical protein